MADMHERVTEVIASKLRIEKGYASEVAWLIFDAMKDPTEDMCAHVSTNINADVVWRQMIRSMTSKPSTPVAGQNSLGNNFGVFSGYRGL